VPDNKSPTYRPSSDCYFTLFHRMAAQLHWKAQCIGFKVHDDQGTFMNSELLLTYSESFVAAAVTFSCNTAIRWKMHTTKNSSPPPLPVSSTGWTKNNMYKLNILLLPYYPRWNGEVVLCTVFIWVCLSQAALIFQICLDSRNVMWCKKEQIRMM